MSDIIVSLAVSDFKNIFFFQITWPYSLEMRYKISYLMVHWE